MKIKLLTLTMLFLGGASYGAVNVDVYGVGILDRQTDTASFGEGIGMSYDLLKYSRADNKPLWILTPGIEAWQSDSFAGRAVDRVMGDLQLRLLVSNIAPYLLTGAGYNLERDHMEYFGGLGLEFQSGKAWSAFTDARYLVDSRDGRNNVPVIRFGFKIRF